MKKVFFSQLGAKLQTFFAIHCRCSAQTIYIICRFYRFCRLNFKKMGRYEGVVLFYSYLCNWKVK